MSAEEDGANHRWRSHSAAWASRAFLVFVVATLALGLSVQPALAYFPIAPHSPANPQLTSCSFIPDPRSNVSVPCGTNSPPAPNGYLNVTIRFLVNVSDLDGDAMNVTFFFDTHFELVNGTPAINTTGSPSFNVSIPAQGPGVNASAEANWTYDGPSLDETIPGVQWRYWVLVRVNDSTGVDPDGLSCSLPYGNCFFPLYVNRNTPAYIENLSSLYDIAQAITFPDKTVPPVSINVTVFDVDDDPVTITWDWGDGSRDVYLTGPASTGTILLANHSYPAAALPLNESNHDVLFQLTIWPDDGIPGHNSSSFSSSVNFRIGIDFRPNRPTIVEPDPRVHWKVNETIPMNGFATDPEGDPITLYYWDFNDKVDANGNGNPTDDRDAMGNVTSHAYTAPGSYNLTLWATDGENKKFCFNATDANCTVYQDHWTNFSAFLPIRYNQLPIALVESLGDGRVGEPMALHASVLDLDADSLNITWDFGDNSAVAYNVTAGDRVTPTPGDSLQSHVYLGVGFFNVTITVRDGSGETEKNVTVFVQSTNLPPNIPPTLIFHEGNESAGGNQFEFNETVYIRVNVTDVENDPLDLEVDWGDGNVTHLALNGTHVVQTTLAVQADCTPLPVGQNGTSCLLLHAYRSYGSFSINITVTDHQVYLTRTRNETTGNYSYSTLSHTIRSTVTVEIPTPPTSKDLGPWDLWDYSTLAILLGIPSVLIGRGAWRNWRERYGDFTP